MWDCHQLNLNSAATARVGGHWLNDIVLAHPWLINCRDQGQKLNKYGSVESCTDFVRSDPILKSSWWSPLPLRLSHFCWVWRIVVIVVSVYCALEGPRHIWSAGETRTSTNRSCCSTNRLYQYYRYIVIRGGAGLARKLFWKRVKYVSSWMAMPPCHPGPAPMTTVLLRYSPMSHVNIYGNGKYEWLLQLCFHCAFV